jgi:hypothetical protein
MKRIPTNHLSHRNEKMKAVKAEHEVLMVNILNSQW